MTQALRRLKAAALLGLLLAGACSAAVASTSNEAPSQAVPASVTEVVPTGTASAEPSPLPTQTASEIPTTSLPVTETPTIPAATPCAPDLCTDAAHFFLSRPIAQPGDDNVDVTYRFGNTQGGRREPHHGVEFLNPYGTPVLAAADGVVVMVGSDLEPTSPHGTWPITYFGPVSNFYGNLVVIEHTPPAALLQAFPDLPSPIYTLYGHLSEILVPVGQAVRAGQEIGKVGMSGVAQGPHLHFEVRLGENTYEAVRNPDLWLIPHTAQDGQLNGALAGSFIDPYGNNLPKKSIVLEHLPAGADQPNDLEIPLLSYEEKDLIGQPPWGESFGVGDIPAGLYRISFPHFGLQEILVMVYPGQLTAITMRVK